MADKERDARIKEQEVENLSGARHVESQKLKSTLKSRGLALHEVCTSREKMSHLQVFYCVLLDRQFACITEDIVGFCRFRLTATGKNLQKHLFHLQNLPVSMDKETQTKMLWPFQSVRGGRPSAGTAVSKGTHCLGNITIDLPV